MRRQWRLGMGIVVLLTALFPHRSWGADPAGYDVAAITAQRTGYTVLPGAEGGCDQALADAISCMLSGTLSCHEAVQIALLNNRTLQARMADLGIACGDLVDAGLFSNPIFEFVRQKSKHPGDMAKLEFGVTLDFMNVLLRPLRRKVAQAEYERAKLEIADEVLELAFDVQSAYYELQAATQARGMHNTAVKTMKASYEAAIAVHEAGNITDLEMHQAQAVYEEQKLELDEAETEIIDLRERLNLLMGLWGPLTDWKIAPGLPSLPRRDVVARGLESTAVWQRLDLAAARLNIETAARELGITNATALFPELEVGYLAERDNDGTWLPEGQIAFPLPIFNQGQGRIQRNRARLAQAQHLYYARAVEVRSDVRRAHARMRKAAQRVRYYQKVIIPLRSRIVEEALLQFNAMEVSVFDLLELNRDKVEAERNSVEALRDYWVSRSELEKAMGGSLSCPPNTMPPERHTSTKAAGKAGS